MPERRVLGIVLAGGEGKRLAPLTADRAKPAVPFGGLRRGRLAAGEVVVVTGATVTVPGVAGELGFAQTDARRLVCDVTPPAPKSTVPAVTWRMPPPLPIDW